jgi:hypothetical protein
LWFEATYDVACSLSDLIWPLAPEEEGGHNRLCVRGQRNRELVLFSWKCPVHPCALVQDTLGTVDITHLEAVDGRRALLDISLVHTNVHRRVDKGLHDRHVRVPQGIEIRSLAPHEMADDGDI